jgi:hypothetical protein
MEGHCGRPAGAMRSGVQNPEGVLPPVLVRRWFAWRNAASRPHAPATPPGCDAWAKENTVASTPSYQFELQTAPQAAARPLDWLDRRPSVERLQSAELRTLSACLMLGCQIGCIDEAAPIAAVLGQWFGDARMVRILMAVGSLLNGDPSFAQAELARDRLSNEADAGTLMFAIADKMARNGDDWKVPVGHVLATSVDPDLRAMAYRIEQIE